MQGHFKKIYEYNAWSNNKLGGAIQNQKISDEKVMELFSHIAAAEQIWMLRIEGGNYSGINFRQTLSFPECQIILMENQIKYKNFINLNPDENYSQIAVYKNSKGIEYKTSYYDILNHVAFHSAYHRAQIAKAMRDLGKVPVLTDYIAFVREQG